MKGVLFILTALLFTGCLINNDALLTEQKISKKKALEDFKTYVDIMEEGHPMIFAYITVSRFNFIKDSLIKTIDRDITQRELFNKICYLNHSIDCAHSNVYLPEATFSTLDEQACFFPYPLTRVDNKPVINIDNDVIPIGAEIIKINHEPIAAILARLQKYNSIDGSKNSAINSLVSSDFGYQYFLEYGPAERYEVDYIKPDSTKQVSTSIIFPVTLKELTKSNNSLYYSDASDIDYDFYTQDNCGVLTFRTFEYISQSRDNAFGNFCNNTFDLLKHRPEIKNLIIDIRENGGGQYDNAELLFAYLSNKPINKFESVCIKNKSLPRTSLLSVESSDVNNEGLSSLLKDEFREVDYGKYIITDSANAPVEPQENRFTGNVFVVVNEGVCSAAAYFASLIKNAGRGKIIGQETKGGAYMHNGFENVTYVLPNSKIQFSFSIANVVHSLGDKKEFGFGVVPDYIKLSSQKDFLKNSDTQINFIIDSLIK